MPFKFHLPRKALALTWEEKRLEIMAILSQWRTPEALWFRVQTLRQAQCNARDLRTFDLAFSEADNRWQIEPVSGG